MNSKKNKKKIKMGGKKVLSTSKQQLALLQKVYSHYLSTKNFQSKEEKSKFNDENSKESEKLEENEQIEEEGS